MPKVFISHSWEDNEISRKIAEYLKRDGADIWIDYARIMGGESLPDKMNEGLEWCDTLVLIWTKAATASRYVKLEWQCILTDGKKIIPCLFDDIKLPPLLRSYLYINFEKFDTAYQKLARALHLTIKKYVPKIEPLSEVQKPVTLKRPQFRSESRTLSERDVQTMLKKYDFYCRNYNWNKDFCNLSGKGFIHQYRLKNIQEDEVVIDQASSLMWQQGGSEQCMTFEQTKNWIFVLNQQGYGSFKDWRLPTLEEAMSLMEYERKNSELYIDKVFDKTQTWIWTADSVAGSTSAWVVSFDEGNCLPLDFDLYVRAVRSGQSSQG